MNNTFKRLALISLGLMILLPLFDKLFPQALITFIYTPAVAILYSAFLYSIFMFMRSIARALLGITSEQSPTNN